MQSSFPSIYALLSPPALGEVLGRPVADVARTPLETEGFSDNRMERVWVVTTNGEELALFLKVFDPTDWIATLTGDHRIREIALFEHGWYDRLPAGCTAPMLAASRHGDGGALLMRDVSAHLFEEGDAAITDVEADACLASLASLHAAHWERADLLERGVPLCSLEGWLGLLTPDVGRRRVEMGIANPITEMLEDGWEAFHTVATPGASTLVRRLHADPGMLLEALGRSPRTLVHGDAKLANLGLTDGGDLVMLDWALAGIFPALIEIGWYLAVNSARLPWEREATVDRYREHLARHGVAPPEWEREVALGLLAGGLMRLGWVKALGSLSDDEDVARRERHEVEWWSDVAERAARWIP